MQHQSGWGWLFFGWACIVQVYLVCSFRYELITDGVAGVARHIIRWALAPLRAARGG